MEKMINSLLRHITFFIVIILIVSCSSYTNKSTYNLDLRYGSNTEYRNGLSASIGFEEKLDFSSTGFLGVPLIPVYKRINDPKNIIFEIFIELESKSDFSVVSSVCLLLDNQDVVCSESLKISALAMFRDDGKAYKDKKPRWNHIQNFKTLDDFIIHTDDYDSSNRVSKNKIFDFYGYSGIPRAEYLHSRFTYSISCTQECPDRFELLAKNIVYVDGLPLDFGMQNYLKGQKSRYNALDQIQ